MAELIYKNIVIADLEKPLKRKNVGLVMANGDENANRFCVRVERGGVDVDLTGCTVKGFLILPSDETMELDGSVMDGMACVDIDESGYEYDGAFTLTIKVYGDSIKKTVAIFDGQIARTISDAIISGDRTIYTSEKILALIDDMEKAEADAYAAAEAATDAAASATAAASGVNSAVDGANQAAAAANAAAGSVNTATEAANAAAENANQKAAAASEAAEAALSAISQTTEACAEAVEATAKANAAANEAQTSANLASQNAAKAEAMSKAAQTATTNASEAASAANTAATAANDAASRSPYIGENGNWYTWDNETSAFVDTGVAAGGGGVSSWNDLTDKPEIPSIEGLATETYVNEQIKAATGAEAGLPTYWQTHLDVRVPEIRAAMAAAGFNKSAFLWYSDSHYSYNYKKSPMLLKYLHAHTPINKTIFGGDIVDAEGSSDSDMAYLWEWSNAIRDLPNHHSLPGNHDDGNSIDNRWDDAYIYTFLQAAEETPDVVRGDSGLYYYIDVPTEKTRYLYLDTATKDGNILNDTVQQEWLKETLLSTPDGWHIVAAAHIWRTYDSNYVDNGWGYGAKMALDMFDAYNARTGDYSACTGKVELCIGGHTHADADFYSDGGIPAILTECDGRNVRSGLTCTEGTITEASINAVVVDYGAGVVNVIRVGRGESRVVALVQGGDTGGDSGDDTEGEETPEVPTGNFTNVLIEAGYKENTRINSSKVETTATGWDLSGFIAAKTGDTIRMANVSFLDLDGGGGSYSRASVYMFNSSKTQIEKSADYTAAAPMSDAWAAVYGDDGNVVQFTIPTSYSSSVAYIRIGARNIDQYSVITVNEVIE